jgi:hypothetical protein
VGRRGEQRIAISFSVVVRGADPRGYPFAVTTETRDVSWSGACLNGLSHIVEPGWRIELECQNQRDWYRVQWVGRDGSPRAGQVGGRCLEPGRYIWNLPPKEWEPDTYDSSKPGPSAVQPRTAAAANATASPRERRQFVRHPCRIGVQVATSEDELKMSGTITDISLGGCYVEMLSPLPVNTAVELSFEMDGSPVHFSAKVRSSHMGFGMGLAFANMGPENLEILRRLTASPGAAPEPAKAPAVEQPKPAPPKAAVGTRPYAAPELDPVDIPVTREVFAAVLRILLRRGLITHAELMEELEKLKTTHK